MLTESHGDKSRMLTPGRILYFTRMDPSSISQFFLNGSYSWMLGDTRYCASAEYKQSSLLTAHSRILTASILFPAYAVALSILTILAHLVAGNKLVKHVVACGFSPKIKPSEDVCEHATNIAGFSILLFRAARFASCLVLLALEIVSLVSKKYGVSLQSSCHRLHHRHNLGKDPVFTPHEWLRFTMCLTYVSISHALYTMLIILLGLRFYNCVYCPMGSSKTGKFRQFSSRINLACHLWRLCTT
jgi:hypothetical protein